MSNKKKTIEFIRSEFEKADLELLTKKYVNNRQKLDYVCIEGHRGSISWHEFQREYRGCKICGIKLRTKKRRTNFEYIKSEFEKKEYQLLIEKSEYINNQQKLPIICDRGHRGTISWGSFQRGHICRRCSIEDNSRKQRTDFDLIKKAFDKEKYELLTTEDEYKNNKQLLEYICPIGHRHQIHWNNWKDGEYRCPFCSHNHSKAENEIYDFIKSYCSDTEQGNRELIKPLELDIIIPSKKLAIEYCGLYWHSEQNGKDKNYHLNKLNLCNKVGYDLITIFEDEYINKKDIVLKRLLYKLNLSDSERVYARNCEIREIDTKTKNKFLDKYHIQGKDNSSIKLGAFYNDKLVSVMTFSKGNISKGSKNIEGVYELNRFCSDYDYVVVGIAGKLFKYFTIKYEPMEVFSYADKRWGSGSFYENLGFKFCYNTEPNYWYVVEDKRVHRFNFRKDVLSKKLEIFDPELTEVENMENNRYVRIFDCGNSKYLI